jgi:hypothetical protein
MGWCFPWGPFLGRVDAEYFVLLITTEIAKVLCCQEQARINEVKNKCEVEYTLFLSLLYVCMYVCLCVCLFKINSLTPYPITTKFVLVTVQNQTKNIGHKIIFSFTFMNLFLLLIIVKYITRC